MASDLNTVALVGRLTRDPDTRYSQNGGCILRFSIAVNRSKRTQDGKWEDEANFFDCVYFGRSAEAVSQYLSKGRQVAVQGELRQDRWEQDGQSRSRVEIWVNSLSLIGGGQQNNGNGGWTGQSQRGNGNGYNNGGYQQSQGQNGGYQQNNGWNGGNNGGYNRGNSRPQNTQPVMDEEPMHGGPEDFSDDNIPF